MDGRITPEDVEELLIEVGIASTDKQQMELAELLNNKFGYLPQFIEEEESFSLIG